MTSQATSLGGSVRLVDQHQRVRDAGRERIDVLDGIAPDDDVMSVYPGGRTPGVHGVIVVIQMATFMECALLSARCVIQWVSIREFLQVVFRCGADDRSHP